jgi:hypothetical protein
MFNMQLVLPVVIVGASILFASWWVFDYTDSFSSESTITTERVGYILAIEAQEKGYAIQFDEVALLTGGEAVAAALRTGACTEETQDDCAPNDFFINDNSALATSLQLHKKITVVRIQEGTSTAVESSLSNLLEQMEQGSYDWRRQLFRVTLDESLSVVKIEEIYLP